MSDAALDLAAALAGFRRCVGDAHVDVDAGSLERAETATFATSQRVLAIVRPGTREEVRACLRVAAETRVPVYAVSRGKNWGLGSRVPVTSGSVLIELGRLDRIVDFDEQMAWITVEPGVTFAALYEFLSARRSRLFANTTGASPGASVVGNALERGDGSGPYGDRVQHVAAIEAALSTGELVSSGFGRFDTPLAPLHRLGVGPSIDGLLSQSRLAVVTRLTLWLQPLPRSLAVVRFRVTDPSRLAGVVERVRELRLDGTVRSVTGLWNDYRVLSTRGRYPWEHTGGHVPLTRRDLVGLSGAWGGATWFGTFALYAASAAQGDAQRRHVEAVLGPAVDDLEVEQRSGEPHSGHELFHEGDPAFRFLQGIPHEGSLESVYWRKRTERPAGTSPDPERDRCGVLWCCPAVPLRGADVTAATAEVERITLDHGFEPLIACVVQTERVAYLVPLLVYDRDVPGEDERAAACHDALFARMTELGYLPYRLGVQSMRAMPRSRDDTDAVLARIERAFDPHGVIAPGRYTPGT